MANVIIAVFATVLGYATSAVVAEVRTGLPSAPIAMPDALAQFRPVPSSEAPAFASTPAPTWNRTSGKLLVASTARAFGASRTVRMDR